MSENDIVYLNVGGLTTNKHEIQILIERKNPSIILLSETHLTENIESKEVNIKNYRLIRCDSYSRHTGGVAMYIKRNIKFSIVFNESYIKNVWTLAIKINKRNIRGVVAVLYHSPNESDAVFMEYFNRWCEENLNSEVVNIIAGDFNINLLVNDSTSRKMIDIIHSNGMKQFVKKPTRVTKTSKSLIDYVISNNFMTEHKFLIDEKISDHETISFALNASLRPKKVSKKVTRLIGYSREQFQKNLMSVNWKESNEMGLNGKANFVIDNIKKSVEEFIKSVKIKDSKGEEWYNEQLRKERIKSMEAYEIAKLTNLADDWNLSKYLNKKYAYDVKKTRSDYYQEKLASACGNQKDTWTILKRIVNGQKEEPLDAVEFDGILATNNYSIATKFNEYYVQSIEHINASINDQNELDFVEIKNVENQFTFRKVEANELDAVLRNIQSKGDPELLSKNVLIDAMPIVRSAFLDVINSSLGCGQCPDKWKSSTISPIPKVPGTIKGEEHRPVNQLPSYEKVMEGVVKIQLEEFIKNNNILIEEQFGFRKSYSCELALNDLLWNWKKDTDEGYIIVAVFLDLKRAFETIDRNRLLSKLRVYGINGTEIKWFESYLSNRTQKTSYNNVVSDEIKNDFGVPQGAKLAAVLFILYINDIKCCLMYAMLMLFADDTLLYVRAKTMDEAFEKMNKDLNRVNKWLNLNKLKINVDKCKYMVINKSYLQDENIHKIEIDGVEIERVDEYKYLGFIADSRLRMTKHRQYICKKVAKKIGFLARIGNKLNTISKVNLYHTIIAPHFQYCASVLSMFNAEDFQKLQIQQNKAMRLVLRCRKRTSINWMLETLGWFNIRQRIMFLTMTMVFKIKNGMVPDHAKRGVDLVESNRYELRNIGQFRIQRVRRRATQNNIFVNGLIMFNNLPKNIRNASNIYEFKNLLKVHIKTRMFAII